MNLADAPGVRRLMSNEDIRALIEAARAEEREACVRVIEEYEESHDLEWTWGRVRDDLVDAIRARGETGD